MPEDGYDLCPDCLNPFCRGCGGEKIRLRAPQKDEENPGKDQKDPNQYELFPTA